MEREAGLVGRLLAYARRSTTASRRSGRRGREDFPLAGEVLDLATGLIVHSRYVEERARDAGYDGPIWRIPHPAWPVPQIEPADGRGQPADRLLRPPEREQARPAAPARVRAAPRARARRAAAARRRGVAAAGRARDLPEGVIREDYVARSGSGR